LEELKGSLPNVGPLVKFFFRKVAPVSSFVFSNARGIDATEGVSGMQSGSFASALALSR